MSARLTEDDIRRVVRAFYAEVQTDALLGPVFAQRIAPSAWDAHMEHIGDFWSSIFLKTGRFTGRPMQKHAGLTAITPAHFTRWLSLFSDVSNRVLDEAQARAMQEMANRIGQSLQMGLAVRHQSASNSDNPFKSFGLKLPT
ncbi:MAG: group III truncated hemoglobin [Maricaulaceae bacterium]